MRFARVGTPPFFIYRVMRVDQIHETNNLKYEDNKQVMFSVLSDPLQCRDSNNLKIRERLPVWYAAFSFVDACTGLFDKSVRIFRMDTSNFILGTKVICLLVDPIPHYFGLSNRGL